jgi:predicted GNAT family acetyltransferase
MVHNPRMGRWRAEARAPAGRAQVGDVDLQEAAQLCAADPVASVLAASRIESALGGGALRGGSTIWGVHRGGRLEALCWAGANLVPVCDGADTDALDAFAQTALRQGRRCSSLVGAAEPVLELWSRLERSWGPARDVRASQPSLVIDRPPDVAPDPLVRLGRPEELGTLLPACIDMFTEEVGYSPLLGAPGAYESRVRGLVEEGRSYVRMEDGPSGPQVVFKAELGAVSRAVAQVQGVWVPPSRRGHGIAAPGMAAVVEHARATVAPMVSLYVNDYNAPALATYRRVGFRQVGTYATVLF